MLKYAVWGNEKMIPLQVANRLELLFNECVMCSDGEIEANNIAQINNITVIGPEENCDICRGVSDELTVWHQSGSIVGDGNFLICPYCFNSLTAIFYNNNGTKENIRRERPDNSGLFIFFFNYFNLFFVPFLSFIKCFCRFNPLYF